jgi:hypothetical protein
MYKRHTLSQDFIIMRSACHEPIQASKVQQQGSHPYIFSIIQGHWRINNQRPVNKCLFSLYVIAINYSSNHWTNEELEGDSDRSCGTSYRPLTMHFVMDHAVLEKILLEKLQDRVPAMSKLVQKIKQGIQIDCHSFPQFWPPFKLSINTFNLYLLRSYLNTSIEAGKVLMGYFSWKITDKFKLFYSVDWLILFAKLYLLNVLLCWKVTEWGDLAWKLPLVKFLMQ